MLAAAPGELEPGGADFQVLILPPTHADRRAMQQLFESAGLACEAPADVAALADHLSAGAGAVVLGEEVLLADPTPLVSFVGKQPFWSDLPLIVLSRAGTESAALTQLIPQLGNVSVVERPMRMSTLLSLVRSSLRARTRQYQVRDELLQREQDQRIIREGEQRYRLLIENITGYAIFMIDPQGNVASWNSGARRMLGYRSEQIVGRPAAAFFTDSTGLFSATFQREMQEALASGRAAGVGWRVNASGTQFFVESVLMAVRAEAGSLLGFAKFMKDVDVQHRIETEREGLLVSERVARSEAERSGRMKEEFLATLSHELRTPLNAVLGWSQVLRRSQDLAPETLKGLDVIERNARAQARIIDDLLDMSSIISGKVRLEVQRLDLAGIVDAAVSTVRFTAQTKDIRLQTLLDPNVPPVKGDSSRLQQVFWNLLVNAVKFTPRNGCVSVSLQRVDSNLEVRIADDGEGIDPAFLPFVFDRFRQADASSVRRHGGLGLGLSIVKQLVELHGGSISAHSAGPGQGATFIVCLPVSSAAAMDEAPPTPGRSPSVEPSAGLGADSKFDLSGVRVLVVDDQLDARSLLTRLLEEHGATVFAAESAPQAVERIGQEAPDVIVSDIGMPGEDGYSFIRRVRELQAGATLIPALALTAYARPEDRQKSIESGYQSHLAKPVNAIEFVAAVARLAGKGEFERDT